MHNVHNECYAYGLILFIHSKMRYWSLDKAFYSIKKMVLKKKKKKKNSRGHIFEVIILNLAQNVCLDVF